MKINHVAYAKLFNLGNYENERIELDAELPEGADHELAVDSLARLVHAIGVQRAEERGADRDAAYAEYGAKARLDRINADIKVAQDRYDRAVSILGKHGFDTTGLREEDDIPF